MKHSLDEKYFVKSVKNALRIMKLFKTSRQELSITEISELIELPKSTVHRLVQELVREGFLLQNEKKRNYQLGFSILALGGIVKYHAEIFDEARPLLQQFVKRFDLPIHICVMEQHKVTYLMREKGTIRMNIVTKSGRQNDLHATAEGLAILAYKNKQIIEDFLSKPLVSYTEYTLTDPDELRKELLKVRSEGIAVSKNTFAIGYSSYAAPIRDYTGEILSSVAVVSKNEYVPEELEEELLRAIQDIAKEISIMLGYYDD
jgi:IclR family KDG regulon transcriptional repressor